MTGKQRSVMPCFNKETGENPVRTRRRDSETRSVCHWACSREGERADELQSEDLLAVFRTRPRN